MNTKHMYTVTEFLETTGLKRTAAFQLFASGAVRTVRVGRRRLVPASAISDFVKTLEQEAESER